MKTIDRNEHGWVSKKQGCAGDDKGQADYKRKMPAAGERQEPGPQGSQNEKNERGENQVAIK